MTRVRNPCQQNTVVKLHACIARDRTRHLPPLTELFSSQCKKKPPSLRREHGFCLPLASQGSSLPAKLWASLQQRGVQPVQQEPPGAPGEGESSTFALGMMLSSCTNILSPNSALEGKQAEVSRLSETVKLGKKLVLDEKFATGQSSQLTKICKELVLYFNSELAVYRAKLICLQTPLLDAMHGSA